MGTITNYYEKYDEEGRITSTKARKIEFVVTTSILDQYIGGSSDILELGAGTGVYSFYYAGKGNKVLATDIIPKHIEAINKKLSLQSKNIALSAEIANAIDLSRYEPESFDAVTCLGPIYHLTEENDRLRCIREALRVLKKGGILAIAYINKHFIPHALMVRDKRYISRKFIDKLLNTGIIKEGEEECFWTDAFYTSPTEMETLISQFDAEIVEHVATDGISQLFRNFIDEMNEEEYDAWLYYSLKSCRDKSILGLSNHGLLVCRKG